MAKKKKSNNSIQASNEFATLEVDNNLKPVEDNSPENLEESKITEDAELEDLLKEDSKYKNTEPPKLSSKLTLEMAEKLEKINALEKHCLKLEEENAKLSDSVNSYLEEIESLKSKNKSSTSNDGEIDLIGLKKELDEARREIGEMRKTLRELREENDRYLIKISELTFENAKLTCQLQEIEKSMVMTAVPSHNQMPRKAAVRPNVGTVTNQPQFANPYLQNGYQDW